MTEGLKVLHERGYSGASVRDIMQAAGAPLGSFSNHFSSKEAFSLEALNLYFDRSCEILKQTLENEALSPIERLRGYVDIATQGLTEESSWNGCLIGNFCAEATEHSELIRNRIVSIFEQIEHSIEECLLEAVRRGQIPKETDCSDLAGFILSSMQGAILESKAERSMAAIDRFKRVVFGTLLGAG